MYYSHFINIQLIFVYIVGEFNEFTRIQGNLKLAPFVIRGHRGLENTKKNVEDIH